MTLGPYATLEVEMVEARDLYCEPDGFIERTIGDIPDAFVKVYRNDVQVRECTSPVIKNNHNPKWSFKTQIGITVPSSMIRLHVYDSDFASRADPMGFVEFCVADLPFDTTVDGWMELCLPDALSGMNVDRYAAHSAKRFEDLHKEQTEAALEQAKKTKERKRLSEKQKAADEKATQAQARQPLLDEPPQASSNCADAESPQSPPGKQGRLKRMFRSFKETAKSTVGAATDKVQDAAEAAATGVRDAASAAADKAGGAVTSFKENMLSGSSSDSVRHNAGEIRVRLKLVNNVQWLDSVYANAMDANCFDFVSFAQAEDLPTMDIQELVDDVMDIKLKLVDDVIVALSTWFMYIMSWRSKLISGLVFLMFVSWQTSAIFIRNDHGDIGQIVWHVGLMILLSLNGFESLRNEMTTGAWNAPCNEEGFHKVAAWNTTQDMHDFLDRVIQARQGIVISEQELFEFAGQCFMDGKPLCSLEEVLKVLATVDFVTLKGKPRLAEGTLVYVDERRRAEVEGMEGDLVRIEMDPDAMTMINVIHSELVEAYRCTPRIDVPPIPKFLLPNQVINQVRLTCLQADTLKKQVIPIVDQVVATFTWQEWKYTMIIMAYLLFRVGFHTADHLDFPPARWVRLGLNLLWKATLVLGFLIISFHKANGFVMIVNFFKSGTRHLTSKRQAPAGWAFFKEAEAET